jgi:hypothetical protein
VKVWGRARVVENDPALIEKLMPDGYAARPEQAILFDVEVWDVNCPQHIPQKIDAAEVLDAVEALRARIDALDAENAALKAKLASQ